MNSVASFLSRWSLTSASRTLSAAFDAYKTGDHVRAFRDFRDLATRGNATAQAMLGRMYYKGEGTLQNLEEAERWIRMAAEEGVPDAQFNLGVFYQSGNVVSRDISEALRWYRRAAQWGVAHAQFHVSYYFSEGLGVDQDERLAAWWASLAAEQGYVDAQLNLGVRYLHGVGIAQNFVESYIWFDLAANSGNGDAITYRANLVKELAAEQITDAQNLSRELFLKPKSAEDSSLQIFKAAASQTINSLEQALGEEDFSQLRTTSREIPSIGKVILEETHGIKEAMIVKNIKHALAEIDQSLDLCVDKVDSSGAASGGLDLLATTIIAFIRRIDDIADVGAGLGDKAADFTHNLLEYHLSLIGALDGRIDSGSLTMLLERFSLRQALRARGLLKSARLHNVLLPLLPW